MLAESMSAVSESFARSVADRYRVERELGRGGMATVYLAEDLKHRRWVAIKLLSPEVGAKIGAERFRREIEIAARLAHPHIVTLHDSGIAGERLFYVMPYIDGESLRDKLDRDGPLPLEDALRLAREIASALGYAHRHGLIHRDIKPGNVLLSDGIALVADFGIARVTGAEDSGGLTSIGTTLGTPAYMAPEQISASVEIDGRADIYSLGCLLYELLAGQPPFSGTFQSLVHQHLSVAPRPVTDWRPDVPPGVAAAIAKSLAKQPADRHATATSFAEALTTDGSLAAPTILPASSEARSQAPAAKRNNLPAERTRFIGREKELADCARLLEDARLLTLTGIGGAGKTRLALRLAADQLDRHPDGVWLVDLAPLADAARGARSIGRRARGPRGGGPEHARDAGTASARQASAPGAGQLRAPARSVRAVGRRAAQRRRGGAHPRHQPRKPGRGGRAALRPAVAGRAGGGEPVRGTGATGSARVRARRRGRRRRRGDLPPAGWDPARHRAGGGAGEDALGGPDPGQARRPVSAADRRQQDGPVQAPDPPRDDP